MNCLICNQEISDNHFPQHLRKHHNISKQDYLKHFNLQNFCACGCGIEIKPKLKWAWGHHSRINNISKREDIRELRRKAMKEWHDSGTYKIWNKGLTIDDPRIKKNIENLKRKLSSPEYKLISSNRMKEYWEEGKLNPLTKKEHWNWKGGTSTLVQMLKSDYSLYKFWKRPILERDCFKCSECLSEQKLTVHHNKQMMHEIVRMFIPEDKHELTYEEKKKIICDVIQYHVDNNVSGVTLCKSCHKKLHKSYNLK